MVSNWFGSQYPTEINLVSELFGLVSMRRKADCSIGCMGNLGCSNEMNCGVYVDFQFVNGGE